MALRALGTVRFNCCATGSRLAGQDLVVDRLLEGRSTLYIAPTGAGKSLSFLIPSMHLPGITLVVIPILALAQDHIRRLPPNVLGVSLGSDLTVGRVGSRCTHGGVNRLPKRRRRAVQSRGARPSSFSCPPSVCRRCGRQPCRADTTGILPAADGESPQRHSGCG